MTDQTININQKLKINFYFLLVAIFVGTFLSGPDIQTMPIGQWAAVNLAFALFYIAPLLFFLPAIQKPNVRNTSWLGFFLLAYLLWGIVWPLFTFLSRLMICGLVLSTFLYTIKWLRPHKKAFKEQKAKEEAND